MSDETGKVYDKTVFGFWVYLLTDFMLFAVYLAVYAVFHNRVAGGPGAKQLFTLTMPLIQTFLLLGAAFFSGLGGVAAHKTNKSWTLFAFLLTFACGALFLIIDGFGWAAILAKGYSWKTSAFLSAYFNLGGLHDLHLIFALLWTLLVLFSVVREGITPLILKRLTCLRLFWQFLNLVWIFVFTLVYLMGGL